MMTQGRELPTLFISQELRSCIMNFRVRHCVHYNVHVHVHVHVILYMYMYVWSVNSVCTCVEYVYCVGG